MIEIKGVKKSFNSKPILKGVNLTINDGETHAIIGRSGCGKSVLLKHIVGLLMPDEGDVLIEGESIVTCSIKRLYEIRRKFGFLFQGAALFDSLNVEENISLPLVENNYDFTEEEIKEKVKTQLELVGLPGTEKLKPSELSGGMKKRISLARSLITNPKYILYDEPTTGLDPIMSDSIDDLIFSLSKKLKVTSILITHDMFSVQNVADKISMVNDGVIYFTGTPKELINGNDEIINSFIKRTGFTLEAKN